MNDYSSSYYSVALIFAKFYYVLLIIGIVLAVIAIISLIYAELVLKREYKKTTEDYLERRNELSKKIKKYEYKFLRYLIISVLVISIAGTRDRDQVRKDKYYYVHPYNKYNELEPLESDYNKEENKKYYDAEGVAYSILMIVFAIAKIILVLLIAWVIYIRGIKMKKLEKVMQSKEPTMNTDIEDMKKEYEKLKNKSEKIVVVIGGIAFFMILIGIRNEGTSKSITYYKIHVYDPITDGFPVLEYVLPNPHLVSY